MSTFVYDNAANNLQAGTLVWPALPICAALLDGNYTPRTIHTYLSEIPAAAFAARDLPLTGLGVTADFIAFGKIPRLLALVWPYPIVGLLLYNKQSVDSASDLIYYSSDAIGTPFLPRGLNWEYQYNQLRRGFFKVQ